MRGGTPREKIWSVMLEECHRIRVRRGERSPRIVRGFSFTRLKIGGLFVPVLSSFLLNDVTFLRFDVYFFLLPGLSLLDC